MVRFEVLAVGKELLIGRTLNTNAHWMGGRLARLGSMIKQMTTVDDELKEISAGLSSCLARSPDILVVVGGLGPTPDDMTLQGVALGLGRRLKVDRRALQLVKEHYAGRGMKGVRITAARRKMATLPTRAEPLQNDLGTAPGVRIEEGRTVIFCLPGVPSEMRSIFKRFVELEARRKLGRLHRKYVRLGVEGMFESAIAPLIGRELKLHPGTYIKSHPRGVEEGVSRIELDIVSVKSDKSLAERTGERVAKEMTDAVRSSGARVRRME